MLLKEDDIRALLGMEELIPAMADALRNGYATSSTDTGHGRSNALDDSEAGEKSRGKAKS